MSTTYKELKKIEDGTQYPVIVEAAKKDSHGNDMDMNQKANVDGYYETFGYAREAGIAKNLQNDEGKLLDPDVETSSGTVYADQPFTQRATAMTMKAYLDNELITVGSGYEQWKKEQAFSVVRNQLLPIISTVSKNGITLTNNGDGTYTLNGTATADIYFYFNKIQNIIGHKIFVGFANLNTAVEGLVLIDGNSGTGWTGTKTLVNWTYSNFFVCDIEVSNGTTLNNVVVRPFFIDLTQWFASRPEIAEALNGDAGIKWFLQNYPQATTLGYDEGTIVDTEDYEYQTTGVNLWDEQYVATGYILDDGIVALYHGERFASKNFIRIFPDTEYYFRLPYLISGYGVRVAWYDSNMNFISVKDYYNDIITSPSNASFMKFNVMQTYGSSTYNHDIQICNHFTETSVEQTYHPYEIYKDKVSWAFTSTGKGKSAGKAADTKDYVNKKNIEKVGRVDMGTLDWVMDYNSDGHQEFRSYDIQFAYNGSNTSKQNILCTSLDSVTPDDTYHGNVTGISVVSNYISVGFANGSYTDAIAFKSAMSGVYLNYELATYIETDMTGDELDTNIPENDYGVERKVPVSGNMFSGSSTTIFYQDNVLRQIYNNKTSIDNLQEAVNNIEVKIPTVPTTDGTYVMTRSGGKNYYTSASTLEMTTDEYNQVIAALNGTN